MIKPNISLLGRIFSTLLILVLLSGCGGMKADPMEEIPAEDLAKKGLEQFNRGKYFRAVETFDLIKERFPFSRFSLLAELKSADCKFYMEDYDEARELYLEFEENHPSNEAMPYVLFQIGRSHYRTIKSIDRDTTGARETIKAFAKLLRTFPDSSYTAEARALTQKSKNFLAKHELYVANFYFHTKEFGQARSRAEYLLASFPDTPAAIRAQVLLKKVKATEKAKAESTTTLKKRGLNSAYKAVLSKTQRALLK